MADTLVKIKIDCSKIDKSKLYKGEKGTYLDATVFLKTEPDQYGNFGMITQDVSKADREAGVKGAILGNVKVIGAKATTAPATGNNRPLSVVEEQQDDLPF